MYNNYLYNITPDREHLDGVKHITKGEHYVHRKRKGSHDTCYEIPQPSYHRARCDSRTQTNREGVKHNNNKGEITMSTRCRIAVEQEDGTIKSIYCHHDGKRVARTGS